MSALDPRQLEPEWLDTMDPDDPRAQRARRDLRLCNVLMGQVRIMRNLLSIASQTRPPQVIADLGTGDGTLMLGLAKCWARHWPKVNLYLIDREPAVSTRTLARFSALGWTAHSIAADIFDWAERMPHTDLVTANLFLHHFKDEDLQRLFRLIAEHTNLFAAAEPLRAWFPLAGSHLLGLLGCGAVARHDAVVSVRAGFAGQELSRLWPEIPLWQSQERRMGWFSHGFLAWKSFGQ
jgi:hypothetical protein